MGVLIAALILVGALVVLDLVLTFGVVRRLRTHAELIGKALENHEPAPKPMLAEGETAGDFTARTVDGDAVSRSALTGRTLIGFFAVGCSTCEVKMPEFTAKAKEYGRDRVLAVVQAAEDEAADYVSRLMPTARVVVEQFDGPVSRAFAVRGTPVIGVVDVGGRMLAGGFQADVVPGLASA